MEQLQKNTQTLAVKYFVAKLESYNKIRKIFTELPYLRKLLLIPSKACNPFSRTYHPKLSEELQRLIIIVRKYRLC